MIALELRKPSIAPLYVSRTPFDERRVGAAAVYCSDGRFGEQMDEFLHEGLGLPRYDRMAIPGGGACLAGHMATFWQRTALERQLSFLIEVHLLRRVVLIAHDGCAFYKNRWTGGRTIEAQQAVDLKEAADCIQSWSPGIEIARYFARKVDGRVMFESWD